MTLATKLTESQKILSAEQVSELEARNQEVAALNQRLKASQEEISTLRSDKAAMQELFEDEVDRLVAESKGQLQDENAELSEEIDSLHKEVNVLRAATDDLTQQLEEVWPSLGYPSCFYNWASHCTCKLSKSTVLAPFLASE